MAETTAAAPVAATPTTPNAPETAAPAQSQSQAATQTPPAPTKAEVKEAKAEAARRYKLKLDGKEQDYDESEIVQLAQQAAGSAKRFQEAAALKKQVEEVVQYLKSNPGEAMKRLGIDPRKFSEEFLVDALKREAESPEQKRIREAEEKIKHYESREKQIAELKAKQEAEAKAAQEKAAQEAKQREIMERYDRVFTEALDKSGLPKNAYTIARMAQLQRLNLKNKLDLAPDSLAKLVKEDVEAEIKHHITGRSGDQLMDMLGKDNMKLITKAQIAKLKGSTPNFSQNATPPTRVEEDDPNRPKTWREFTKKSRFSKT